MRKRGGREGRRREEERIEKRGKRTEKRNQSGLHIDKRCGKQGTGGASTAARVSISCSREPEEALMSCS